MSYAPQDLSYVDKTHLSSESPLEPLGVAHERLQERLAHLNRVVLLGPRLARLCHELLNSLVALVSPHDYEAQTLDDLVDLAMTVARSRLVDPQTREVRKRGDEAAREILDALVCGTLEMSAHAGYNGMLR